MALKTAAEELPIEQPFDADLSTLADILFNTNLAVQNYPEDLRKVFIADCKSAVSKALNIARTYS